MYSKQNYVFDAKNRGRISRQDQITGMQDAKSDKGGIMRSYMPLAQDDILQKDTPSDIVRPVDSSTYVLETQQAKKTFSQQVTPLVNSISGNMLMVTRVMARCIKDGNFVYQDNPEQLKLLFKNYISSMLYNAGGHSMEEFVRTLRLPEIQDALKGVPAFKDFTLESLFKEGNESAFNKAIDKTIEYNDIIVNRQIVREELLEKNQQKNQQKNGPIHRLSVLSGQLKPNIFFGQQKDPDKFKQQKAALDHKLGAHQKQLATSDYKIQQGIKINSEYEKQGQKNKDCNTGLTSWNDRVITKTDKRTR